MKTEGATAPATTATAQQQQQPQQQVTVARKRGRRRQQSIPDQPNGLDRVFVWDIDGSLVRRDTITDSPDNLEPSVLASVTDKLGTLAKRFKELTLSFCDEHLFLSELESSDQMHIDDVPSEQEMTNKKIDSDHHNNNQNNNNNNNNNNVTPQQETHLQSHQDQHRAQTGSANISHQFDGSNSEQTAYYSNTNGNHHNHNQFHHLQHNHPQQLEQQDTNEPNSAYPPLSIEPTPGMEAYGLHNMPTHESFHQPHSFHAPVTGADIHHHNQLNNNNNHHQHLQQQQHHPLHPSLQHHHHHHLSQQPQLVHHHHLQQQSELTNALQSPHLQAHHHNHHLDLQQSLVQTLPEPDHLNEQPHLSLHRHQQQQHHIQRQNQIVQPTVSQIQSAILEQQQQRNYNQAAQQTTPPPLTDKITPPTETTPAPATSAATTSDQQASVQNHMQQHDTTTPTVYGYLNPAQPEQQQQTQTQAQIQDEQRAAAASTASYLFEDSHPETTGYYNNPHSHHNNHFNHAHNHYHHHHNQQPLEQQVALEVNTYQQLASMEPTGIDMAYGLHNMSSTTSTADESFHQLASSAPDSHYSDSLWSSPSEVSSHQHHSSHGHLHMAAAAAAYNYNPMHHHHHHNHHHEHSFHAAAVAAADVQHQHNNHHPNHHHHHQQQQQQQQQTHHLHQSIQHPHHNPSQQPQLIHHHHHQHQQQLHQQRQQPDLSQALPSHLQTHHHQQTHLQQPLVPSVAPLESIESHEHLSLHNHHHHHAEQQQQHLHINQSQSHQLAQPQLSVGQMVQTKMEQQQRYNHAMQQAKSIKSHPTTKTSTSDESVTAIATTTTTATTTLKTVLNNHHKQLTHKLSMRFHRLKTVYNLNRSGYKGDAKSSADLQDTLAEIDHYTLDWRKRAMDCLRLISESPNCTNIIVTKLPLVIAFGHLVCLGLSQYFEVDQVYSASKTNKEACLKRIKKRFGATNRCSYIIVGDREDVDLSKRLDLPSWPLTRSDGHRQLSQLHTALKDGYLM